jgi:ABC-type multidrug transport system ATPase subunit
MTSRYAIAATGLRKSIGGKVVLDGIDLDVAEGTIFALLGPNGAGKTTAVQIIRDLVADGVTIFLTTQNLDEADQLADRIAVLDQGRLIAERSPGELKRRIPGAMSACSSPISRDSKRPSTSSASRHAMMRRSPCRSPLGETSERCSPSSIVRRSRSTASPSTRRTSTTSSSH